MNRRKTAALAAVTHYLRTLHDREDQNPPQAWLRHSIKPWTFYGRRTTAQLRHLVQGRSNSRFSIPVDNIIPEKGLHLQQARYLAVKQALPIARAGIKGNNKSIRSGKKS